MTSLRIRLSFICQTAGVVLMLSVMAVTTSAQTFTWDFGGVDNNWSTDGNWSPSPGAGGPDGAGVEVILDNTSSSTAITLDSDRTVGTVSIDDSDNYTLSGNTLTLDASSGSAAITIGNTNGNGAHTISSNLALADDLVITNNATSTFTASGIISGSSNLTKAGTGTVTFSGASTYSGTTTVSEGQLSLADGAQSALSNSAVTVSSGATLMLEDFETFTLGSLAGGGTIDISDGVLETGGDNTSTTFSGSLDGDSFSIAEKRGSGTWTLTGSGHSVAEFDIFGGTAVMDGASGSFGEITIFSGSAQLTIQNTTAALSITEFEHTNGTILITGASTVLEVKRILNSSDLTIEDGATVTATTLFDQSSGESTIVDEAELIINEFGSGSLGTIAISDASSGTALTVGNSDDSTFQGVIEDHTSGSGSVLKTGTGTVTFSGASTYSGSTTISEGILQIGNSLALQNSTVSIDVDDGLDVNGIDATLGGLAGTGTLDLGTTSITIGNNNADTTYSGVISGTGSLTKSGTGTTTLSGDNTYTGTTTISGGTLQVGDGGSAGALGGNITNNANLIFSRSDSSTYAGDISGTGILSKQGSGTLTLTGTHTYTGATTLDAGILQVNGSLGNTAVAVNNGATLGGSGTITGAVTVNSGGTLAPGNSPGTQTVGSLTLNTGSTTQFEINGTTAGTDYDQIVVTGTAQLAGTAELSFGFTPSNGDTFTLIDAATITGDFDSVVNSLGNALLFTTSVTDDYILTITAVQTSFASDAFTGGDPELIAIATVLDDNFSDLVLESLIDALNGLPGTDLEAAFEQINPDELAALSGFSFANTRNAVMRLSNRLRAIRHGAGGGIDTSGFSLFDQSGQFRSKSLLADVSAVAPAGLQLMEPAVYSDPRLGMFVSGSGTFGDYDGDANGAGYDYDAASVLIGADYRITDTAAVGVYGGYDRTDANLGNNGGQAGADTARFGATGTWWAPQVLSTKHELDGTVYAEANLGGAYHWYETDRNGFGGVASGETGAAELSAGGTLGYEFKKGNLRFGPEVSLNYTHLWTEGFTETGSLAPLSIAAGTRDSLYSTVGARASYRFQLSAISIQPYAHAGWRHEYLDTQGATTARFAAGVGSAFTVNGSSQARDSIVAGFGINAMLNDWLSAELSYFGEGSADTEIHSINGSITARF